MATIHNFAIARDQTKYFSYFNGAISEISREVFNEKRGTGIGMSVYVGRTAINGGSAYFGKFAERTVYAQFFGDSIFRNSTGPGQIIFVIMSNIRPPAIDIRGSIELQADGSEGEAGSTGSEGGGVSSQPDFGIGDPPVRPPEVPTAATQTPLPTGNGNSGFTTPGSAGAQLGITGGNS